MKCALVFGLIALTSSSSCFWRGDLCSLTSVGQLCRASLGNRNVLDSLIYSSQLCFQASFTFHSPPHSQTLPPPPALLSRQLSGPIWFTDPISAPTFSAASCSFCRVLCPPPRESHLEERHQRLSAPSHTDLSSPTAQDPSSCLVSVTLAWTPQLTSSVLSVAALHPAPEG